MCSKNRSLNIQMVDFTQAGDAFDPQAELNDALARMNVPPKSAWVEIKVSYVITNHKYIYIYINTLPSQKCHRLWEPTRSSLPWWPLTAKVHQKLPMSPRRTSRHLSFRSGPQLARLVAVLGCRWWLVKPPSSHQSRKKPK